MPLRGRGAWQRHVQEPPFNQSQMRVRNRLLRGRLPRSNEPIQGELALEVSGSLGITSRNRELMTAALVEAKANGGPWIAL